MRLSNFSLVSNHSMSEIRDPERLAERHDTPTFVRALLHSWDERPSEGAARKTPCALGLEELATNGKTS